MSRLTVSSPFDNHALRRIASDLGLVYPDLQDFDDFRLEVIVRRVIRQMKADLKEPFDASQMVQQGRIAAAITFVRTEL